jgi:hypothetical protein
VKPKQHWSLPSTSAGSQRWRCSACRRRRSGAAEQVDVHRRAAAMPPPWLATSCIMIAASVTPSPAPPYSGGIVMPSQPASAIARWNSCGNSPSSSRASQYSSSNERTTALTPSRIARWSSLIEKSMRCLSSGRPLSLRWRACAAPG